ncbi:MAG TPA: ABC transporter substrate-binding protein [Mycobacteriales bacterium]|nr:ABC transporter substrate-binding protein [Mycobacteriales bacterium]
MTGRGARSAARARRRGAAAAVLLCLVATACGARLPGDVQKAASNAVLQPRQGSAAQSAGNGGGVNPVVTSPAGAPNSGSLPGVPSSASTAPADGGSGPTAQASASSSAAASECSGGTDVGLTASTLTLGEIATLSGPVSGLFDGAVHGGEAFANYVNHAGGGICGRQVKVDVSDDGANCTQDENATQNFVGKAFALSGSFALYDGCGATVVKANPGVADIHVALDPAAESPANHFDISAKEPGFATGMFRYYKQKYGSKLDHIGTIVEDIPSAVANQANFVHSAESEGWHFTDSILEQATNSNFQQDFNKLCSREHIQVFFELTEPAGNAAEMVNNERQAGCPKSLINIFPIAYDQGFLQDFAGNTSALDGMQGWTEYALFFNKDEAANNPEVKLLQEWYSRTYPGVPINLYGMYAWASDRLLEQAADSVKGPLTRKSLLSALRKIKSFSDNGLIAPVDPNAGGPHCYILFQFRNGGFERVDDPKTGYRCDGRFLPRPTG